jgi:hypothetical protein
VSSSFLHISQLRASLFSAGGGANHGLRADKDESTMPSFANGLTIS